MKTTQPYLNNRPRIWISFEKEETLFLSLVSAVTVVKLAYFKFSVTVVQKKTKCVNADLSITT